MPLNSNPDARMPFSLNCDAATPLEKRPTFLLRGLSVKDHQKCVALTKEANEAKRNDEAYAKWKQAVSMFVAGWKNLHYAGDHPKAGQPVPFDLDELLKDGVLNESEAWELLVNGLASIRPLHLELKNFESQPSSAGQTPASGVKTAA